MKLTAERLEDDRDPYYISPVQIPRSDVLTWLQGTDDALRLQESAIVELLSARSPAPKRKVRAFVREFMR